jgi:hypothetical protein
MGDDSPAKKKLKKSSLQEEVFNFLDNALVFIRYKFLVTTKALRAL